MNPETCFLTLGNQESLGSNMFQLLVVIRYRRLSGSPRSRHSAPFLGTEVLRHTKCSSEALEPMPHLRAQVVRGFGAWDWSKEDARLRRGPVGRFRRVILFRKCPVISLAPLV